MEEFDEMVIRVQKEEAQAKASASMVFWQAEINMYEEQRDYGGNYDCIELAYFQDEANAKAWLLEAQAKIAPLDQWANDRYEDDYSNSYIHIIHQIRTED